MNSKRVERDSPAAIRPSTGWVWLSAAWAVALVSTSAALFIGEVMGMTPCQLCWYQRILMFPLALILGIAAFGNDRRGGAPCKGGAFLWVQIPPGNRSSRKQPEQLWR